MKIVVLTGGVGGAKFVLGLQHCGKAHEICAIVNTGDDFNHLGLNISPDIDTLLYTLSGKANVSQGWGREGESWAFMSALKSLGGADWFNLGDGDLALHILRTERLARGEALSEIIADFAKHWSIGMSILPMSNDPVSTALDTDDGEISFQNYFVKQQCRPIIKSIRFEGSDQASPTPGVVDTLLTADAVFIAPSNPWLSVDPILAVRGIADALKQTSAPVVAISPLIGGKAVKGPTTKLMAELGIETNNQSIANHYAEIIDGLIYNIGDTPPNVMSSKATATLMTSLEDKVAVAKAALDFARELRL